MFLTVAQALMSFSGVLSGARHRSFPGFLGAMTSQESAGSSANLSTPAPVQVGTWIPGMCELRVSVDHAFDKPDFLQTLKKAETFTDLRRKSHIKALLVDKDIRTNILGLVKAMNILAPDDVCTWKLFLKCHSYLESCEELLKLFEDVALLCEPGWEKQARRCRTEKLFDFSDSE